MSAGIVVSMNQVVVVPAQVLATVCAELCGWLAAPFLMLFQLIRTPESANVANFYLLTCFQSRIHGDVRARNRFDNSRMRSLCRGASTSLTL